MAGCGEVESEKGWGQGRRRYKTLKMQRSAAQARGRSVLFRSFPRLPSLHYPLASNSLSNSSSEMLAMAEALSLMA